MRYPQVVVTKNDAGSGAPRVRSPSPGGPAGASNHRLSLLLLLLAANQRMVRLVERELAADGVDHRYYGTVSVLGAFGPLRLTELAADLGMPLTTMSDIVRRLEGQGLVSRSRNADDRRSFLFELSAHGEREWRRGWGALQRIDEHLRATIDQDATRRVLSELGAAFEAALDESG